MAAESGNAAIDKAMQAIVVINKPNQSPEELAAGYDQWAPNYDEGFNEAINYIGHTVTADTVVKYLSDSRDVRVLDVAAGTGAAGEALKALGFTNVDALDPSVGMLECARQKNFYKNYIVDFFPCKKSSIETSSYDVLTAVAVIGEGHMKADALPEMVRCVKPGGLVVITGRALFVATMEEYRDRFEPMMKQLESEGKWKILERTIFPNYYHIHDGIIYVMRVTKTDN